MPRLLEELDDSHRAAADWTSPQRMPERQHPAEGYRAGRRDGQQRLPQPRLGRPRHQQDQAPMTRHAVGAEELAGQARPAAASQSRHQVTARTTVIQA